MKCRFLLSAIVLGLGLVIIGLILLARPTTPVRAHPRVYYVTEGGSIQAAINVATSPGDEVWVATGTYVENLTILHGVRLRGGWDVLFAVQDPTTYPTIVDGNGDSVVYIDAAGETVELENLTLINGRDGIHVDAGTVTITHCSVQTYTRQGIEIDDGNVWLMENLIRNGEREGIEIDAGIVTVFSNTVDTVGRHGIQVQGGMVLIEGNIVHAVQQNSLDDYHGIEISGTQVVSGNQISDIDHYGIFAHNGASTIINNAVHGTGGDGIHTDNTSTSAEIRRNSVYNAGSDGIDSRGQIAVLASNTVHAAGKDGIHVDNASAAYVQSNAIYGAGDDGIDAGGDAAFITSNIVNGCGESGIKAEVVNHTIIHANQVYRANQDEKINKAGIDLDDAGTFTIINNIVAESNWASVLVETDAGPCSLFHHNTLVGSTTGQQGLGVNVMTTGITITLVNNIVVSHSVGITAPTGATLIVSRTLLYGNGHDPISGTAVLPQPPMFMAAEWRNLHLAPDSPAVDAGIDVGVTSDVDGDGRPNGALPDIGADEYWPKTLLPLVLRNASLPSTYQGIR